jgi:hypothetical protein
MRREQVLKALGEAATRLHPAHSWIRFAAVIGIELQMLSFGDLHAFEVDSTFSSSPLG